MPPPFRRNSGRSAVPCPTPGRSFALLRRCRGCCSPACRSPKGLCARTIAIKRAKRAARCAPKFLPPKGQVRRGPACCSFTAGALVTAGRAPPQTARAPFGKRFGVRRGLPAVPPPAPPSLPRRQRGPRLPPTAFVCARAKELGRRRAKKSPCWATAPGGALAAYTAAHDWGNSPRPCAQVLLYPVAGRFAVLPLSAPPCPRPHVERRKQRAHVGVVPAGVHRSAEA